MHVKQLIHEKRFNVEYRMSPQAFTRLRIILYRRLRRRINRIEMAFGRLVRKFQVLKRKIEGKLGKISQIISACARLHNFIIDMDVPPTVFNEEENDKIVPLENGPQEMGYLPTMLEDEDEEFEKIDSISETRNAIVDEIKRQEIRRPNYNIQRKTAKTNELIMYYHPT
jgi:hypothetical protein